MQQKPFQLIHLTAHSINSPAADQGVRIVVWTTSLGPDSRLCGTLAANGLRRRRPNSFGPKRGPADFRSCSC